MGNNIEVNLKARTTDFTSGLENANKLMDKFGKTGGDLNKTLTKSFSEISKAAKNNLDSLQKDLAAVGVNSDIKINVDLQHLAKAKEAVNSLFNRISEGGASVSETTAALNKMNMQLANANSHQTKSQFKDLGILSEASIEAMKAKSIAAYLEIERSGVATANDIQRANEAMTSEIERLDNMRLTNAEKTAAAKIALANETVAAEIRTYEEAAIMNQKFEYDKQRAAEKTAAAKITALREVAANERAAYASQGMAGVGAASNLINQKQAGPGFTNSLKSQMEEEAAFAQMRTREMSSYAAAAMQGEGAAARLVNQTHMGAENTARLKAQMEEAAKHTEKVSQHTEKANNGMSGFSLASVAAIAKIQILYSLINNVMSTIGSAPGVAIQAIEDFNSAAITNAALITSMQGKTKDVGTAYKENKEYALAVQGVLVKMDAETSASAQNLSDMNRAFIAQGVIIDVNNAKQIEGFKNTANAIEALTHGNANQQMQYTQEVKAMLKGEDRAGNQLFQALNGMDNGMLKQHLVEWQKIAQETGNYGLILEKIGPMLQGFAAAQGDINALWSTTKSTMATIRDEILRGGLSTAFSEMVDGMKEVQKWAEENKIAIQRFLSEGFKDVKTVVTMIWDMRGALVAMGAASVFVGILTGVSSIIEKLKLMNRTFQAGTLFRLLSNPVVAVGTLVVGTAIAATKDANERAKAQAEANRIASVVGPALKMSQGDLLPGHIEEMRKKFGDIGEQEIISKFVNKEVGLETVIDRNGEYAGQQLMFNEQAPKKIKSPTGLNVGSAEVDNSVGDHQASLQRASEQYKKYLETVSKFDAQRILENRNIEQSNLKVSFEEGTITHLQMLEKQAALDKTYYAEDLLVLQDNERLAVNMAIKTRKALRRNGDGDLTGTDAQTTAYHKAIADEVEAKITVEKLQSDAKIKAANSLLAIAKDYNAERKKEDDDKANAIKMQRQQNILNIQEKITNLEFETQMGAKTQNQMLVEKLALQKQLLADQQLQWDAASGLFQTEELRLKLQKEILAEQKAILVTQKAMYDRTSIGGFTNAIKNYAESAQNMGKQIENMTVGVMNNMENALTNFVATGKLSFKDLAGAIIQDLVRIQIRAALSGIFSMIGSAVGSYFTGGVDSSSGGTVGQTDLGTGYTGTSVYGNMMPTPTIPAAPSFSAAGGFDIPNGSNPIVQTHSEEMILPKGYADVIRNMADNGGSGTDGNLTVNVVNQSGHNVKAKEGSSSFDGKNMVKTIILEAMDTDPGFRWAMRGGQ